MMKWPSGPPPWVVALGVVLAVATIIIVSAAGEPARPAAYCGAAVGLAILIWGTARQSD
jgi:hypothetical protein